MSQPKRLFIIDAMAMAFRNFHAFSQRPLSTDTGFPTSAIFGSALFLIRLIEQEKPDYILVATDSAGPNFRHEMYPDYKANRGEMPEDLAKQIPVLFRLFEALDLPLLKENGLEADDLIGSLVTQYANDNLDCYIVSGDKDFMQLINEHVFLYSPKKGGEVKITDIKGVKEKYHCTPKQVIDVLAVMGDSADNVPGVRGIGEKGATKLVSEYGSLEKIYENVNLITNKRQQKGLLENKEMALLSKKLVTIKTDVKLDVNLEKMLLSKDALANQKLLDFFKEFQFKALTDKIANAINTSNEDVEEAPLPNDADAPVEETIKPARPTQYKLANSPEALNELLTELNTAAIFSFDTETTGLDIVSDKPIGISFSTKSQTGWYLPLIPQHLNGLAVEEVKEKIKPLLQSPDKLKVAHNIKFDYQMLENIGLTPSKPLGDSMLMSYVVDASGRFSLDYLSDRYLGITKIPTKDLIGKKGEIPMFDVDLKLLTKYAAEDADCCFRLYEIMQPSLENKKLTSVYEDMDLPIAIILAKMEKNGIFVDEDLLSKISNDLNKSLKTLTAEIYEIAGEEFNISSPKQLKEIIFEKLKIHEKLGIKKIKKTKSGYSTDMSVLEQLSEHPLARKIIEYRTASKLKSTYVDTLPQLINPKTHRIHTSFHETGTQTGRLSSSNPNIQNIPIRSEVGKNIRKAFKVQDPNNVIISADYSQIELRLLAHISGDKNLKTAFLSGEDIHKSTAATMFKKPLEEVTSNDRSRAKAINYGIVYGMGPKRLAKTTGVTMKEAKDFINAYFESFPRIKDYIENAINSAKETGYSQTFLGRRRPIPGIEEEKGLRAVNAQNMAINSPIQGSAADLIKIAMINIQNHLDQSPLKAKMLLQVHDELVFECPSSEKEELMPVVQSLMINALKLDVPLEVDVGYGENWLEAH